MRDEFVIVRQGRNFVLFAGLLDEAHNRGLKAIDTELLQVPDDSNGRVAVVKATVELEDGRRFSGIGDASPENVGRNIVPHVLRMAETRAKARALRDAINVGMTALEELGGDEQEPSPPTRTPRQPAANAQRGKSDAQEEPERTPGGATVKAANFLKHLAEQSYGSVEAYEESESVQVEQMSAMAVKRSIERLK